VRSEEKSRRETSLMLASTLPESKDDFTPGKTRVRVSTALPRLLGGEKGMDERIRAAGRGLAPTRLARWH
jgi:hypothetical protein